MLLIIKAALPEASIFIDCLGIASNDPLLHRKAIDLMENLHMKINKKDSCIEDLKQLIFFTTFRYATPRVIRTISLHQENELDY